MVKIGEYNHLRVAKQVDFGLYLDGGSYGEILLPKRYIPAGLQVGQMLDVFIYLDSEDRLIATTEKPLATVGECAYLKVVDTNRYGAFLEWGLPKDLLVPRAEQESAMQVGKSYVVYVYLDERSESIVASSRLSHHLSELGYYFKAEQPVDLLIYARSELGYKAVIDNSHIGLLFDSEVYQSLKIGQRVSGFIKQVRPDRRIDLSLRKAGEVVEDGLAAKIIEHLKARGGSSTFTDKTAPELIYQEFQVSKAHFKRALGLLYKQQRILLSKDKITLV
ncbi:CvfB family protein [Thiolinea disciformis]|uniref:CvfB family protein n=1 Tax=Thiolinea disciformis TaxID=125614 RepID=UPI000374C51A|nr:S1-like domain-containing RNA-binding protein [Thiolinea disciformis]